VRECVQTTFDVSDGVAGKDSVVEITSEGAEFGVL
jgi:hypothetical protein